MHRFFDYNRAAEVTQELPICVGFPLKSATKKKKDIKFQRKAEALSTLSTHCVRFQETSYGCFHFQTFHTVLQTLISGVYFSQTRNVT